VTETGTGSIVNERVG